MGESNELIEVALTVAIALAVGFTSAAFGRDSPVTESSDEIPQMRTLVEKVVKALAPVGEETANSSPQAHLDK
jgi:hypothetical protein